MRQMSLDSSKNLEFDAPIDRESPAIHMPPYPQALMFIIPVSLVTKGSRHQHIRMYVQHVHSIFLSTLSFNTRIITFQTSMANARLPQLHRKQPPLCLLENRITFVFMLISLHHYCAFQHNTSLKWSCACQLVARHES